MPAIVSSPKYKMKQDCPHRCAILALLYLENTSRRWQSTLCKKTENLFETRISNSKIQLEILTRKFKSKLKSNSKIQLEILTRNATPKSNSKSNSVNRQPLITGDFMIFRLCENQCTAHCFLGEQEPLKTSLLRISYDYFSI